MEIHNEYTWISHLHYPSWKTRLLSMWIFSIDNYHLFNQEDQEINWLFHFTSEWMTSLVVNRICMFMYENCFIRLFNKKMELTYNVYRSTKYCNIQSKIESEKLNNYFTGFHTKFIESLSENTWRLWNSCRFVYGRTNSTWTGFYFILFY